MLYFLNFHKYILLMQKVPRNPMVSFFLYVGLELKIVFVCMTSPLGVML